MSIRPRRVASSARSDSRARSRWRAPAPGRTYVGLFMGGEFRALFGASAFAVAATTLSGLALATLVFARTHSPLLSALSMFGPSFGQVLGATTLLSAADRLPPRATLAGAGAVFAGATLVVAVPGLPVAVVLLVGLATGVVTALAGAVRWGLLTQVLPAGEYVLGRSAMNMSVGAMQIVGFASGAVLLHALSPGRLLVAAAALHAGGALTCRFGLEFRPARASGRASLGATWRVNRALLADRRARSLLLASWIPNGLVVGAESLFIPYAGRAAGALFVAAATGMLCGDAMVGRAAGPGVRPKLGGPMRFLLPLPYLAFVGRPGTGAAAVIVGVASVGFCATLIQQERLVMRTDPAWHGQLLGLQQSGMQAMQAVGASLAGAIAEGLPVGASMAVMAAGSLLVSAALTPGLRAGNNSVGMGRRDAAGPDGAMEGVALLAPRRGPAHLGRQRTPSAARRGVGRP